MVQDFAHVFKRVGAHVCSAVLRGEMIQAGFDDILVKKRVPELPWIVCPGVETGTGKAVWSGYAGQAFNVYFDGISVAD